MEDSKILITGADGQLGRALRAQYPNAQATTANELDIANQNALENYNWDKLTVVINAAGYTNVDGAETLEGRVSAWRVNAMGAANLAKLANQKNLTLVHLSTDYVFDGTKNPHTEDEPLSPISSYGASKAAGDIAVSLAPKHYLLRTSWIIGDGRNFVRTMLELGRKDTSPMVVTDQMGRPTFTTDLAKAIDFLLLREAGYGTYNVTGDGEPVSWANLARVIFSEAGFDLGVTDTTTAKYLANKPGTAKRPLNSLFDLTKIKSTGFSPRNWREDLSKYIKEEVAQ